MQPRGDFVKTSLVVSGIVAVVAALFFGIGGWVVANGLVSDSASTIRSAADVVEDAAVATEAAGVSVTNMRTVVEEIESAARSGARTLGTVEELLSDISDQATEDVARSLESTVDAMPGIIRTGLVIDRALSALSLVGVDYDPEVPLDTALESIRDSLRPLPDEIREQSRLLDQAAADLARIAESSASLAARLLEIRIDLLEAEDIVNEAARSVDEMSTRFNELADDFDSYRTWMPWLIVAAAVALGAVGTAILLLGLSRDWLADPAEK